MARVTVEDCVEKIPNRFDLVMIAAQRARDITAGAELTMDRDNDKNPVVSLREIADQTVDYAALEETLVKSLQRFVESDEPDVDEMDMASMQEDLSEEIGEPSSEKEINADVLTVHDISAEELAAEDAFEAAQNDD